MHVTLHVWRVPRYAVGSAMLRTVFTRRPPGIRFARFLGTGTGTTFGPTDADLTRWAAVVVSDRPVSFPGWDRLAVAAAHLELDPLTSRGTWGGVAPFGSPEPRRGSGMVLALTRARLRPARMIAFYRAARPVAREVAAAPGLLARFGVGEAPIGWQGTVSVWRDATDLTRFAYRQPEHQAVVARTPTTRWYTEELFARFAVRTIDGDRAVLGWRDGG